MYMDEVDTNDDRDAEVAMVNFKIQSWHLPGGSE
jgi:hypothetical protein